MHVCIVPDETVGVSAITFLGDSVTQEALFKKFVNLVESKIAILWPLLWPTYCDDYFHFLRSFSEI